MVNGRFSLKSEGYMGHRKTKNNSTLFVPSIRNLLIYNSGEFRGGEVRDSEYSNHNKARVD